MLNLIVFPARLTPDVPKNLAASALLREDARYCVTWPAKSQSNAHFMFDVKVIMHSPTSVDLKNFSTHLVTCPSDVQGDVLKAMFAFHEVFFDTTRSQNGQLYLFSHGIMMVHWDNAKAGKRFHDTPENDSEPNDITDNFDIRFFGNSHHDKLAFIADVKRALVWHSDDLNGPVELTFPSVFWN